MPKHLSPVASLHVRHPTPNLQVAFARAHSQNRNTLSFIPTIHSESLNPKFTYFQTDSKVGLWAPRHYVGPLGLALYCTSISKRSVYTSKTYICMYRYGRHGVFPSPFVLCFLRHPLPPPLRFCGSGRKENPPPPCGTGWFPFCHIYIYIHTHHVFVNVWPFYLSTNPPPVEQDGFPFCSETHTHTHTHHVSVYVWHSLSVHALLLSLRSILPPSPLPPPWYPVMYSCTSISNGRHGVFSPPPPVEQDIPPAVLWFCNCACRPGRNENPPPPPLWNRMVFPFAIHTHTPCLCECMTILSPNPSPVEQDGFPFCSATHTYTHTHHVSVYVWHSLSLHALLLSLRSILWCAGQAGYDTGCGTPVVAVLQASRLQALVFERGGDGGGGAGGWRGREGVGGAGGGEKGGEGGAGSENAKRKSKDPKICAPETQHYRTLNPMKHNSKVWTPIKPYRDPVQDLSGSLRLCVSLYVYVYTHIHTCIYVYIYIHMYQYNYLYMYSQTSQTRRIMTCEHTTTTVSD